MDVHNAWREWFGDNDDDSLPGLVGDAVEHERWHGHQAAHTVRMVRVLGEDFAAETMTVSAFPSVSLIVVVVHACRTADGRTVPGVVRELPLPPKASAEVTRERFAKTVGDYTGMGWVERS